MALSKGQRSKLEKLVTFITEQEPDIGADEKGTVQPFITQLLRKLNTAFPDTAQELVDAHNETSFGTRKPDIVGYVRQSPHTSYYISLLGEVKGRTNRDHFTNEDKGKLESFMEDLFALQPDRRELTGFLTDGAMIQFFKLKRVMPITSQFFEALSDHITLFEFFETPQYRLQDDGLALLLHLVSADAMLLGAGISLPVFVNERQVNVQSPLGHGSSAVVYSAKLGAENVVMKKFFEDCENQMECEYRNLQKIQQLGESVTQLVAYDRTTRILLLKPVGIPFASSVLDQVTAIKPQPGNLSVLQKGDKVMITAKDFCSLVDILKRTHKIKLVHRDLSTTNFLLNQTTGKVSHFTFGKTKKTPLI